MKPSRNIAVFCSAASNVPERFQSAASELVTALCKRGYGIVSGGSYRGTMGAVSNAVYSCGGYHKGILPRFMGSFVFPELSETLWTETMSERKEEMRRDTVAAIALPGGIGTLDEFIETHVLKKLGKYSGRIILLNIDGFFNPFLALLDHYVNTGMLTPHDRALVESYESVESLLATF